jgi:hypothetical protein
LAQAKSSADFQEFLDRWAKESGATDHDNNGTIDYRDILFTSMKNVNDFSRVIPVSSGYIWSIHTGDTVAKTQALINISLSVNNLKVKSIPAQDNPNSHNPALLIESTIKDGKILYTLDGSSPHPNNPKAMLAFWSVVVPAQDNILHYRELSQIDGKDVLWKVKRFDLSMDWIELSQENQIYNPAGKYERGEQNFPYKNTSYTITTESGIIDPGYLYPKNIWCYIGKDTNEGCDLGPYKAYNVAHESRIIALIHTRAKSYIDEAPITPIPPEKPPVVPDNPREIISDGVKYKSSQYWIYHDWTLGTDGKRKYPIQLSGEYTKKDWKKAPLAGPIVMSASEKTMKNTEFENTIKSIIDKEYEIIKPPPIHKQNEQIVYQENKDYYGGWYSILNQWNLSGTSDYPVKVIGTYAIQNKWRQANIEYTANNETERITLSDKVLADVQSRIQEWYRALPPPNYPPKAIIDSWFIPYKNGYGYNLITTMNINGDADYPATVYVKYTTPSGEKKTATITAKNAAELTQVQNERVNEAKAEIDRVIQNDKYPPWAQEQITQRRSYANGSFETRFQYSFNSEQDYPGYIDVFYTRWDGYRGQLTRQVDNENQKKRDVRLLEDQARLEIDNYPYFSQNTETKTDPIPYGSKWGNYQIFAKYNRVWSGYNYPALIWIQYRTTKNWTLFDTRTTYWIREAKNSEDKEQIKVELERWVKGQIVASGWDLPTVYATDFRSRILEYLPLWAAVAGNTPTITIRKWADYFGKVVPYTDPTYSLVNNYLAWLGKQTYLTKKWNGKPWVSGKSADDIKRAEQEKIAELKYRSELNGLIMRIFDMQNSLSCYWAWTTINNCWVQFIWNFLPEASSVYAKSGTDWWKRLSEILFGWFAQNQFNELINEMITKYPSNMLYMYAIIFEEQSHLFPPVIEDSVWWSTFWLWQILIYPTALDKRYLWYTEVSKADALDWKKHLAIMNERLNTIRKKMKELNITETPEMIGRAWNGWYKCMIWNCNEDQIAYWKRIQSYMKSLEVYYNNRK